MGFLFGPLESNIQLISSRPQYPAFCRILCADFFGARWPCYSPLPRSPPSPPRLAAAGGGCARGLAMRSRAGPPTKCSGFRRPAPSPRSRRPSASWRRRRTPMSPPRQSHPSPPIGSSRSSRPTRLVLE